jgi:hypothetical protein
MVGIKYKHAAAAVLLLALAGCASGPNRSYGEYPQRPRASAGITEPGSSLQCVPYAREKSGILIYGDAYTWWNQAEGRYARDYTPAEGSVMVLYNYAGPRHGHVAVVTHIVSAREIRVNHANWLNNGAIYENNPVYDISPDNDWSEVKIFNIPADAWGSKIYPVQGFILPSRPSPHDQDRLVAQIRKVLDESADETDADEDGAGEAGAGSDN